MISIRRVARFAPFLFHVCKDRYALVTSTKIEAKIVGIEYVNCQPKSSVIILIFHSRLRGQSKCRLPDQKGEAQK